MIPCTVCVTELFSKRKYEIIPSKLCIYLYPQIESYTVFKAQHFAKVTRTVKGFR